MTADLRGHTGIIENFCWSHDSKFIYSCGTDSKLIKWDAFSGVQIQIFENDGPDMDAIAILHNGKIVVGNDHGELCIFSKDLNLIRTYKAHESGIKNVILYEQSNNILTVGYGGFAKVLNMNDTITELATTELPSSIWARSADFYSDDTIVFGTFASKYANGVSRRDVGIFLKWKVRFHSIL
jgi:WD40 repeat protein